MTTVSRRRLLKYGGTLISLIVGVVLAFLLRRIDDRIPFLLFFGAVAFSAGIGGLLSGLLATIVSVLVLDYFFLPPINQFTFSATHILLLVLFSLISVFISSLYDQRKRAENAAREQRESLRVTLLSIGDAVIATDEEGRISVINPVAEKLTGWQAQTAIGREIREVFHIVNEQTRQPVDNPALRVLKEKTVVGLANHTILIGKDGTEYPIDDSGAPIRDQDGKVRGAVLVFRDITERKHIEELAQHAAARTAQLQAVTAALGKAVIPTEAAKIIVEQCISALAGAYGAMVALLTEEGQTLEIIYHTGYSGQTSWSRLPMTEGLPFPDVVKSKAPLFLESKEAWHTRYPNREELVTSESLALLPLLVEDRAIGGMVISYKELQPFPEADRAFLVTLAQQCAQALWRTQLYAAERQSRAEAETARKQAIDTLESIGDAFVALDKDWRYIYANRKAEQLWGGSAEQLIGKVIWDVIAIAPDTPFYIQAHRAATEQIILEFEQFLPLANAWFLGRVYPSPEGVSAYFQDITARKQAETALHASEERLKRFMESNIIGINFATSDGRVVDANDLYLQMIGYTREEMISGQLRWWELTPPEFLPLDRKAIADGEQAGHYAAFEKEYIHKDGHHIPILLGGTLTDGIWVSFVMDLTERKRAEKRLRLLTKASALLASSLDYSITLTSVARLIVPDMADWCSVHILQADASVEQLAIAHVDPAKLVWAEEIQSRYPADPSAPTGLFQVIRSGQSEIYPDITDKMLVAAARDADELQVLREIGYSSAMIVALKVRGRTLGALQFVSTEGRQRYTADDLALAEDLARRAAVAVDNARLYGEVREQRERLQVTLASIGDAVIATDEQGRINFMNAVAQTLTGWSQEDAAGKPLVDVFHIVNASTRHLVESPVAKVMREGAVVGLANHTVLIARDDREIPIDDSGAPIRDENGHIEGVILVFRDVTDRQRAEENQRFLLEAGTILSASLDEETTFGSLAHLIVPHLADNCAIDIAEDNGSLRRVAVAATDQNQEAALREIMQRYPSKIDHATFMEVFQTRQPLMVTAITDAVILSFAQDSDHADLLRATGSHSSVRIPLVAHEQVIGLISIGMAQSGRHFEPEDLATAEELARRATLALENIHLYHQAQAAIGARNEFLSVAAHELKTPITSLRGFAQMLQRQLDKRGSVNPEQLQHALTIIDSQSVKLTKLINQLLDLARLEAGRLALDQRTTDLVALINEVVITIQRNTQKHTITVQTPASVVTFVDPLRLEQVLINLLDNAIKYSPQGGAIAVELSLVPADQVRISVTDHGIGIPLDRRQHIFDRFYQAHGDGYLGGMGLGLYISRQIIDLHGGQLEVEFPSEGGTRFIVTLPLLIGETSL